MKKIEQFQITSLMLSGFKSYEEPTELVFGDPTVITGGNGRGKSSIADAIAFAVTGCPFFGERGIDRLHNENNPDVAIRMCFVDETGTLHELNRTRRKNRMTITYDGYEIRQLDLADLFGERDVFLSIFNPLYFIEELGEDGKKLLERYLPTIPHETVLSQLSEPVREHLKNETILSPEGSLKRCREEIRGLEERITYLRGQKDLAASQGESHEQAEQEVTLQADTLREEIAELEQRQFSGMDVSNMQERLVELSGRYEEAARDECADTSKLREQLQTLREKIARREGEQYQSKFTEALAEASARVKDLGVRYQRENAAYKAFHAGMECPACHRSVTEQSLPEVQAALKKVLSELYAAGSEQRAQLIELQEMDKKAADTFAQFKEDDLGKWAAEAAEMEQRCASLAEQASAETERLRAEIQTLTADLEYTMTKITMFKAIMVSWIRKDCSQSPNREPNSIASSSVRRLSSTSGVISVPFWIMPADCCITCWLTSKTASTILKVFVRIITATKVLNTHLKNIHVSTSDEYCQDGFSNETVNTLRTMRFHRDFRAKRHEIR